MGRGQSREGRRGEVGTAIGSYTRTVTPDTEGGKRRGKEGKGGEKGVRGTEGYLRAISTVESKEGRSHCLENRGKQSGTVLRWGGKEPQREVVVLSEGGGARRCMNTGRKERGSSTFYQQILKRLAR